jgi:hypothetical protein
MEDSTPRYIYRGRRNMNWIFCRPLLEKENSSWRPTKKKNNFSNTNFGHNKPRGPDSADFNKSGSANTF